MATRALPPAEYLRQCFDYDPGTGALTWRSRPREHFPTESGWRSFNAQSPGTQSGSASSRSPGKISYMWVRANGSRYRAHRIIWAIVHGSDPGESVIDHIDGNGINNRIGNLRLATHTENIRNSRAHAGKLKGASFNRRSGKWRALIRLSRKLVYLGEFPTEAAAHAVYCAAAEKHFGEFARFE